MDNLMLAHYADGHEAGRLGRAGGQLEFLRTQEIVRRFAPPPPANVLDVGGGPGAYATWLSKLGYRVRLLDPVPLHVEQARQAGERCGSPLDRCLVGDARRLECPDEWADAALLLGPLYHLVERQDRLEALREARRVLRPGGVVFAVAITRFASALDGMRKGYLADSDFRRIVEQDLLDGQHRNPALHPAYFTTAFFHHPDELEREILDSGFELDRLLAVEGPAWLLSNLEEQWNETDRRGPLLDAIRWLEGERSILGASAHIMAIARKVEA